MFRLTSDTSALRSKELLDLLLVVSLHMGHPLEATHFRSIIECN